MSEVPMLPCVIDANILCESSLLLPITAAASSVDPTYCLKPAPLSLFESLCRVTSKAVQLEVALNDLKRKTEVFAPALCGKQKS